MPLLLVVPPRFDTTQLSKLLYSTYQVCSELSPTEKYYFRVNHWYDANAL